MDRYFMKPTLYMYSKHGLMMYTGSMMYFDRRVSAYAFFGEWSILTRPSDHENPGQNIDETCLCRAKSGQTTAPAWCENINLASLELICAQVILKGRHSPFWCMSSHLFSTTRCLGNPNNAARDAIWIARGNSIIIGGNTYARATAKPYTIKWFHLVTPEHYLTTTEMENSAD